MEFRQKIQEIDSHQVSFIRATIASAIICTFMFVVGFAVGFMSNPVGYEDPECLRPHQIAEDVRVCIARNLQADGFAAKNASMYVIYLRPGHEFNKQTLNHELCHVQQFREGRWKEEYRVWMEIECYAKAAMIAAMEG